MQSAEDVSCTFMFGSLHANMFAECQRCMPKMRAKCRVYMREMPCLHARHLRLGVSCLLHRRDLTLSRAVCQDLTLSRAMCSVLERVTPAQGVAECGTVTHSAWCATLPPYAFRIASQDSASHHSLSASHHLSSQDSSSHHKTLLPYAW